MKLMLSLLIFIGYVLLLIFVLLPLFMMTGVFVLNNYEASKIYLFLSFLLICFILFAIAYGFKKIVIDRVIHIKHGPNYLLKNIISIIFLTGAIFIAIFLYFY